MNLGVSRPWSARSAKNTGEHGEPAGTWSESEAGVREWSAESNPASTSPVLGAAAVLGGVVPGV